MIPTVAMEVQVALEATATTATALDTEGKVAMVVIVELLASLLTGWNSP